MDRAVNEPAAQPFAVRITFTRELPATSRSRFAGSAVALQVYIETLQREGERFAIDYVRQWIEDGSPIPTFAVIDADGNVLTEGNRLTPVDPRDRQVPRD